MPAQSDRISLSSEFLSNLPSVVQRVFSRILKLDTHRQKLLILRGSPMFTNKQSWMRFPHHLPHRAKRSQVRAGTFLTAACPPAA
jgi:hypothetical protein